MDTCIAKTCTSFAADCLNRFETHRQHHGHWNWSMYSPHFQFSLMKQRYDSDAANQYNRIGKFDAIIQNDLLAHGQYLFSLAILFAILLLIRRPSASQPSKKDEQTMYLFKDLISLLKLLHWNNCDYLNIIFTTSCFLLFMALLPLLLALWLFVLCYRQYIYYLIKVSELYFLHIRIIQYIQYCGLLSITRVFCAVCVFFYFSYFFSAIFIFVLTYLYVN